MNIEKYTQYAQEALFAAQRMAQDYHVAYFHQEKENGYFDESRTRTVNA
jgi:hypothetical protein